MIEQYAKFTDNRKVTASNASVIDKLKELNKCKIVETFNSGNEWDNCGPKAKDYLMMKDLEIQEQAERYANTSQFLSDFPHDKKSVNYGFLAGAKWMQEQDGWTSCDIKPEKEFIDILILFESDCSCSGYYVQEHDVFMPHSVMYRGLKATHWQNLPKPPKTK